MMQKSSKIQKNKNIFDHLNQITKYKIKGYWESLNENERKEFNIYMINRYLSMNYNWVEIINILQKYNHSLPKKTSYLLYNSIIPKTNIFLRYIKNKSKKNISKEVIEKIKLYYKCSEREALEYSKILDKKDIKELFSLYGEKINAN